MNLVSFLFESKIDAWLKANNKESFSNEQKQELESLINDFARFSESIYNKDSTQYNINQLRIMIGSIKLAKSQNLKSQTIKWLTKQIFENLDQIFVNNPPMAVEHVEEDYIPILKSFEKNKSKIEKPLESFKDITELTYFIQDLSKNSQETNDSSKDIILEKNGWILAMPSNTENSCDLGQGTTWCTARTDSQNMFLNYVGRREENIILFYVMKQGGNPRKDPFDKMSVGFLDGKTQFGGGDGTISVNASNKGLTEKQFRNVLGNELANEFLEKMKEVSDKVAGKHPAKEELSRIVRDYDLFVKKTETFKNQETLDEFFSVALEYDNINPQIFEYILEKTNTTNNRTKILADPRTPVNLLRAFVTDKRHYLRVAIARNPNVPVDILRILATDENDFVLENVVTNPNITHEIFTMLTTSNYFNVRLLIAKHPKIPGDVLEILANDRDKDIRRQVVKNPNITINSLRILATDKQVEIRRAVAGHSRTPVDVLQIFKKDVIYVSQAAEINMKKRKLTESKNQFYLINMLFY